MIYSCLRPLNKLNCLHRFDCIKSNLCSVLLSTEKSVEVLVKRRFKSLGIIGAPFSKGQPLDGVQLGPNAIRSAGLMRQLERLGHDVIDFGDMNALECDLNIDKNASNHSRSNQFENEWIVREMCLRFTSLVKDVVESGRIPITLGGDHSIAIGSICGNASVEANRDMCVVWVDAHADINTVETTKSGHFHGMPVSFLLKEVAQTFNNPNQNCLPIKPCISAHNFAYIGLQDVESHEMDILKKLQILHFSMDQIDKLGILEVIARTLDKINPNLKRKIHVSFDIDSVDQMLAPSTGTPVPAGLTIREALCIGEQISNTNLLCGLDLVEVNPLIGDQNDVNKTVNCALNIILSFLGKSRADLFARNPK